MADQDNPGERSTRRSGGGREARRAARETKAIRQLPFINRNVPPYTVLNEEALVQIEENADTILQEIGVEFRDDPEAIQLWKDAGADVDGERVRMPKGMARELCKTAPSSFIQHARNPQNNVMIGENATVFAPVGRVSCLHPSTSCGEKEKVRRRKSRRTGSPKSEELRNS